jgi:hypothetical protein
MTAPYTIAFLVVPFVLAAIGWGYEVLSSAQRAATATRSSDGGFWSSAFRGPPSGGTISPILDISELSRYGGQERLADVGRATDEQMLAVADPAAAAAGIAAAAGLLRVLGFGDLSCLKNSAT